MKKGDKVRILIKAGLTHHYPDDTRFVDSVEPGTIGTYLGKHPSKGLAKDGWRLVEVEGKPGLVAPVGPNQFEPVP